MNQILRTLLPRCEASTRTLLSSCGASGVLHVLAGAALAAWFGSMAPRLFPPQQGFNSIQLTAQMIVVKAVDAEPEVSPPVIIETATAGDKADPSETIFRREATSGIQLAANLLASVEAIAAPSASPPDSTRRGHSEQTPEASSEAPILPRAKPVEPPLPTQTNVASEASLQDAGQLDAIPTQIYSPQPNYPADALQQRLEGRVVLRLKIDVSGRVAATSVLRTSGHSMLDEAARQAVLQWRFDPPKRLGVAVQTEVAVPVHFRIEDE